MTVRSLVVAIACLGLVALATPAFAHAELESSTPDAGATVDGPLRRVVLAFSAPVDPPDDGIRLLDADGRPVPASTTVEGAVVRVRPDTPLTAGRYGVRYAITAEDAHTTDTSFTFRVSRARGGQLTASQAPVAAAGRDDAGDRDAAPAAGALAAALATDPTSGLRLVHTGLHAAFTALAFSAVGVLLFLVVAWEGARREVRLLSRLVTRAALATSVVVAALVAVTSARAAGGWSGALDAASTVVSGRYALGTGLRLVGALLLLVGTGPLRRLLSANTLPIAGGAVDVAPMVGLAPMRPTLRPGRRLRAATPALLGAGLLVGSFGLVGHAADAAPRVVSVTAAVLHTLAGAAWGGGLLALVTALGHRHRSGIALRAGAMVRRFSSIATFGVVTAAAAGTALAAVRLDAVADLWTTRYGLALSAKTAVVVVVAGVGAYNHLVLVPRVARAHDPAAERRLRRLGMIEVVLIAAVLGITAALVGLAG